jgi:hypothetical protein
VDETVVRDLLQRQRDDRRPCRPLRNSSHERPGIESITQHPRACSPGSIKGDGSEVFLVRTFPKSSPCTLSRLSSRIGMATASQTSLLGRTPGSSRGCYSLSGLGDPLGKAFGHLDRFSASLIGQQMPDLPAASAGEQPQLTVAGLAREELQHGLRVRGSHPLRLGHSDPHHQVGSRPPNGTIQQPAHTGAALKHQGLSAI